MILFEILSPLGFHVRTTEDYWIVITTIKHPRMSSELESVKKAVELPDEIRRSRSDENVYLFYSKCEQHFCCAVVKHEDHKGYLITAYLTDKIKEGDTIWKK